MPDFIAVSRFRPARPQPSQSRPRPPQPLPQAVEPIPASAAQRTRHPGFVARWLAWRWSAWTSPLLLLAIWSLVTSLGWAPEQILVSPLRVLHTAWELVLSGELAMHLEVSLLRLLGGFAIGGVTGIGVGLALGLSPRCRALVGPTFEILRQLPSVALIPLFILLFGIGESFKVLIVVKSTFFIVGLAVYDAVANLSQRFLEVARIYCFTRWQVVRHVVLPAIMPAALTGMRIALSRSWMVLVGAELMAAESGLGQMMEMARQMFRLDVVMVGVLLTGSIGFVLDRSLRWLEAYLGRWQRDNGKDTQ